MAGHKTDVIEEASLPSFQEYQYAVGVASDVQGFQSITGKKSNARKRRLYCQGWLVLMVYEILYDLIYSHSLTPPSLYTFKCLHRPHHFLKF
jgi:hypothetical protein